MKSLKSCVSNLSIALLALNFTPGLANNWFNETYQSAKDELKDLEKDFDKAKSWFEGQVAQEVASGLKSVGGVLAHHTFSLGPNIQPPVSASPRKSKVESEVTVGLFDKGGGYKKPAEFDFAQSEYKHWNQSWFGIAVDSFDAEIELEIDLSGADHGETTISLLSIPLQWEGVGVDVEFQLYLSGDASASMSFTAGVEIKLENPGAIMMPALDPIVDVRQAQRIGFHTKDWTITPIFTATMPKLDFNVELALRTVFSLTVEEIDVGSLTMDLPAFNFSVNTLTNKLSDCTTPPPGTPSDQIYAELIHAHGELDAVLSYDILDGLESGEIERWDLWNIFDKCYAFLPGVGTIGPVPNSSKSPILTADAVESCTSEGKTTIRAIAKPLSTGDKAGIAVGAATAATLIAALAWFGGRASQRHSMKRYSIDKADGSPNPGFGSFFNRNKSNEYPSTRMMPVPQTDYDAGSFAASPDPEMQMQRGQKDLPYVIAAETVAQSSTDITPDGQYGAPVAGPKRPEGTWDSVEPRPAEYGMPKVELAEGVRLLPDESRLKVPSRKPLGRNR